MDTSLYINKIEEHLADPTTYKELNTDPTQAIRNDVISTLDYLHSTHRIDDETRHHLTLSNPARTPLFYGLPKVHKPNIPLGPTVSACDSPTDQLSNYVTHFRQPLVEIIPSYIQDSKHVLQLLESLPPLPENAILVTADVTSLYTNIPLEEGIEAVLHNMKLHADTLPPDAPSPHTIGIFIETILKNNNPSFMEKHFLLLVGTAMGTKAAPPYANLFMGRHEQTIREAFIRAIPSWKRFTHNIFLFFLGTTNQFQSLQNFMNHLSTNYPQRCTENPLTVRRFYTSTPTTHSSVKKALFFHKPSDTTSSLQTTYYKKSSIPSQYPSLPENTHQISSLSSPRPSSTPVKPFSANPPRRNQVPELSSQL